MHGRAISSLSADKELFHLWAATARDSNRYHQVNLDRQGETGHSTRTSSIIWQICRKQDSIDSNFPEMVTARSVEVGNISEATCTDAPVVY